MIQPHGKMSENTSATSIDIKVNDSELAKLTSSAEQIFAKILASEMDPIAKNIDSMFLIFAGSIIIFMQAGFAMFEAGTVRSKNVLNILMKNMSDLYLGKFMYT